MNKIYTNFDAVDFLLAIKPDMIITKNINIRKMKKPFFIISIAVIPNSDFMESAPVSKKTISPLLSFFNSVITSIIPFEYSPFLKKRNAEFFPIFSTDFEEIF